MRALFIFLLASGCCLAEITNVRVLGTTATQAAIAYTAPDTSVCSVAVSQTADLDGNPLVPLVHDVDTTLFPESDRDTRSGSIVAGRSRIFIAGKRTAEIGSDGSYDSRALQANTVYYGKVTCGSSAAVFSFQTTNIPQGLGYGDPWPTDPANPGAWAATTGPGSDPAEINIDPQTGVAVKRFAVPGYGYSTGGTTVKTAYNQGQNPCDVAGPWVSPCNVTTNTNSYASVSNSTGWLASRPNQVSFGWGAQADSYGVTLQQILVSLTGHCDSSNPSLCQIDVCLSMNSGASCASSIKSVTLPQTTDGNVSVGTYNPGASGIDPWVYYTEPKMSRWKASAHSGNVTVSGSVVTYTSGDWFDESWTAGGQGRIRLSNVSVSDACTASSGTSVEATIQSGFGTSMTLTSSPGAYTYYCAPDWAIMIRRHVADAATSVFIKNVAFSYVSGNGTGWPAEGFESFCSNTIISGGFLCMQGSGGGWSMLTWTNSATGVTNTLVPLYLQANNLGSDHWGNVQCPSGTPDNFSTIDDTINDVPTWYCIAKDSANKFIVLKVRYTGSVTSPLPYADGTFLGRGAPTWNQSTYTLTYSNATVTLLTPGSLGQDLGTMATAFSGQPLAVPGITKAVNCTQVAPVQNGVVLANCNFSADTLGWFLAFSPGDHDPNHAGQPGGPKVIGAMNTWTGAASRFSRNHSISCTGQTSGVLSACLDPLQGSNTGNTSVVVTTHTPMPSPGVPCSNFGITYPSHTGWTGNNAGCIQVTIDANAGSYEPYFLFAAPNTDQTPGALATAEVGDLVFEWGNTSPPSCWFGGSGWCEVWQLMQKGVGGDNSQWIFARNVASGNTVCPSGCSHNDTTLKYLFFAPTNWNLNSLFPGQLTLGYGYNFYWDYVNDPHGLNTFADPGEAGGHGFMRPSRTVFASNSGYVARSGSSVRNIVTQPNNTIALSSAYAGVTPSGTTFVQSHASPSGDLASSYEAQASFDMRPQSGQTTVSPGAPWRYTKVSGPLYVTSPTTTDADTSQILHRKVYATAASSGMHPLIDISGPGSVIDASASNNYKYCVVRVAGECYGSSSVGQIYVNVPGLIQAWCYGPGNAGGGTLSRGNDICITDASPLYQGLVQFDSTRQDLFAANQRVLIRAFAGPTRATDGFQNARALPDNSWVGFPSLADRLSFGTYILKLPPLPAADSVTRNNFVSVPVNLKPTSGVNNAIVEFGYQEYGGNCTTRNEVCIANTSTIGTVPFKFAGENPAGLACSAGCTIAIPAISQRMLYYKVKYRDSSNNVLAATPAQLLAIP